jgi:hypothetical protein
MWWRMRSEEIDRAAKKKLGGETRIESEGRSAT